MTFVTPDTIPSLVIWDDMLKSIFSSSTFRRIVSLSIIGLLTMSVAPVAQAAEGQTNSSEGTHLAHPSERADESVAEKVNDPTAYLRRLDLDTDFNWINYSQLGYKVTPGVLTPLGERFRLRVAAPITSIRPQTRATSGWEMCSPGSPGFHIRPSTISLFLECESTFPLETRPKVLIWV